MVRNLSKNILKLVVVSVFFVSYNCNAGIYEEIKRFVTTDSNYIHCVGIAVGTYSLLLLLSYLVKSHNLDYRASIVASFLGACVISKIAKDYPGYTTVAGATYGTLRFFDIIKPLF